MEINRSQKILLQYLKDTKESGPSLFHMYKLCWKCSLALVSILLLMIVINLMWGLSNQSLLYYGVVIGAFIRDLGMKRKQLINWPVQTEIINWGKVDDLLSRNGITKN